MPLYIVVNADGHQQRVSPLPLEAGLGEELLLDNNLDAEPSATTHAWNPVTRVYESLAGDQNVPYSRTKLTKREFLNRIGKQTIGQINARLITPPQNAGEVALIAELMTMKDFLNAVPDVDLEHPDTVAFADGLVALAYKTAEQRAAMLAPATVPAE